MQHTLSMDLQRGHSGEEGHQPDFKIRLRWQNHANRFHRR